MRNINIKTLHEAAPLRLPGYVDTVRSRGRLEGEIIILSDEDYDDLRRQFQMPGAGEIKEVSSTTGTKRFEICKSCARSRDEGFGCVHHVGCCFGRWRSQPENKCYEGKW
jgi:hypothetical protein